ncbi:hypothetical protein EJB05_12879, partial [Eragrostis curvula]
MGRARRRPSPGVICIGSSNLLPQTIRRPVDLLLWHLHLCASGFDMDDVVRKYIRCTLNEKPFNPDVAVDLIHLKALMASGYGSIWVYRARFYVKAGCPRAVWKTLLLIGANRDETALMETYRRAKQYQTCHL